MNNVTKLLKKFDKQKYLCYNDAIVYKCALALRYIGGFMFEKKMKKPYVTIAFTVIFLLMSMLVANAEAVIGVVVASSLNVRQTASNSGEIVTEVEYGSEIVLLERTGDWYKVNVGDIGFVHANYIRTQEELATGKVSAAPATDVTYTKGQQVLEIAKQYIGTRYVYGGTTPNGFDCSGLMQYVYRQMGVTINRVAADQAKNGVYVAKEDLQPGDLVFFAKPGRAIHHVGMYAGNGQYLHAPYTGRTVTIENMTRSDYYTARRIFY